MKNKMKKVLASVLAAGLMLSSFSFTKAEAAIPEVPNPNKTVMLVPLDDRPMNTDTVKKAAAAAGIKLIMPPKNIIATSLQDDKTGAGSHGGDASAVIQWIRDNDHLADGFIFSADMIHSGGLVESRSFSPAYTTSQGTTNLNIIDEIKKAYPNKPLYAFDSVMRFASTQDYEGLVYEDYKKLRTFGEIARNLDSSSHANVKANYNVANGGGNIQYTAITEATKSKYYAARSRKFDLNKVIVDKTNAGKIDYVVFGVDDSNPAENTIQTNEINWLTWQKNNVLINKSQIVSDIDGISLNLLARMTKELYNQPSLKYYVEYFGTDGKTTVINNEFLYENVHATLKKQIEISGGTYVTDKNLADVSILALSPKSIYRGALVSAFESNMVNSIPTVVMDFYDYTADSYIMSNILAGTNASRMLAYSAWNTLGNRMGIALGTAGSRMNFMKYETDPTKLREASKAFASLSIDRIAEDYGYKGNRQKNVINEIKSKYTGNEWNMKTGRGPLNKDPEGKLDPSYDMTPAQIKAIDNYTLTQMQAAQNEVVKSFSGRRVIEKINGPRSLSFVFFNSAPTLTDSDVSLPWNRYFEVQIDTGASNLYD
ncbi:DUF4127 family protein [Lysinibacillus xylanilyticus]|uniref:DUF4127 family protein n=1 Tax=Lysinibacillus xylanilyticus TaxID=582475 RepID=UPI002B242760|nr:DUF4127 family protein [Lysinibacillus xylanilyticus]MEB2280196.1 DUF4127 family protein [Lysinibacillus xylanilyticus]